MRLNKIASAISRGLWLIEPRTAVGLLPVAAKFLAGEAVTAFEDNQPELPMIYHKGAFWGFDDDDFFESPETITNGVMIIPINGAIMKEDYCGEMGTDTMSRLLTTAMESPMISGVVLKINSGGGTVEGTGEFADLVKAATKPVLAYTDGLMASAAYWIGCSALEIYASHKTVEIGSIGTAISFYDNRGAMEKYGVKQHYINADSSPDKNQDYFKALDGDYSGIKVNILNPTNDIFMGAVKANRGERLKTVKVVMDGVSHLEPLTGKMYLAETAMDQHGMIDGIANIDFVIKRVLELAA